MKSVSNQKTKRQTLTRAFSWCLSFSITLTFALGFAPFDNQNIQVAKATTLDRVYDESGATSTTTSTSTYSTKLTGSDFVSGHKYFIFVTMGLTHSSATGRVNYRIWYGSSPTVGTALYTGDIEPAEATANYYTQVDWMDVYTPSSSNNLYVLFKGVTAGTTTAANAVLMALDLSSNSIVENYDYYFNENTTSADHSGTAYEDKANITLDNADGTKDWLVFATEHIEINEDAWTSPWATIYNYNESSHTMGRVCEGEDAADDYSFILYRPFENVSRGTKIALRVRDSTTNGTRNKHTLSRIFALNLQVFRDRMTFYNGTDIALGAAFTDLYDSNDVGSDDYTASSTDSHVFFSSYMNNVAAANARSNNRFRIVDPEYPPDWDWTDGLGGRGKISYDPIDETSNNIAAALTVSAGDNRIIWQAHELGTATAQVADERAFAIFSAELNYRPQINNWRWYADEEDTTPGTAYAAENTAPPQVEMGKSIGMKLRINLTEVGGLPEDNNRKKLYYATSSTGPWTIVGETIATDKLFRYYDADTGGADNTTLDSVLLTGSSSTYKGIYNKGNSDSPSNSDHVASTTTEFEYGIENFNAAANTVYYFALFDQTISLIAPASGKSFPTLTTASSYNLSLETAPSAVYLGSWQIGDGAYHSYDFTSDEKFELRDNRGRTGSPPTGNSSGWTLSADVTTELKYTASAASCSIPVFTGSGANDMLVSSCNFSGDSDLNYKVEIDGDSGKPDTFKWSDDGGSTWDATGVAIDFVNILNKGIIIQFADTAGHAIGDYWEFTAHAEESYTIPESDMYWTTSTITGLYDASITGITGAFEESMSGVVTAVTVSGGSSKQGLGGFRFQPTLRIYNASTPGNYVGGVITFTLA